MPEPIAPRRRLPALARASAAVWSATLASALLSFAFVLLVARPGGPRARGALAFATAVPTLLSFVATLGLESAALYFASKHPAKRQPLATLGVLSGTVSGVTFAAAMYGVFRLQPHWVPDEITPGLLGLTLGVTPFMTVHLVLMMMLIGCDRIGWANAIRVFGPAVALLAYGFTWAVHGHSTATAVAAWTGGQLAALIVAVAASARTVGFASVRRAGEQVRPALRYGLAAHVGNVADMGTFRFDALVLGATRSAGELGIYAAAANIAEALLYLPTSVSNVLLPAGARRRPRDVDALTRRVMATVVGLASVAAAIGIVFAPWTIRFVFGSSFAGGATPLRILLLAILGTAARRILWAGFAALGRQSRASAVAVSTLATVVVLDLLLIPSHGAVGAAWASLAAYWLGGILLYGSFRRMSRSIVERTIDVTDVPSVDVRIRSLWQRK